MKPEVFISYSSIDGLFASRVYEFLINNGVATWFAPMAIKPGENFADKIADGLGERAKNIDNSECFEKNCKCIESDNVKVVILILSQSAMHSKWVLKEVKWALKFDKRIIPLQIDHCVLTGDLSYSLVDIQIINAYHLPIDCLHTMLNDISPLIHQKPVKKNKINKISYDEIGIRPICTGDPYYEDGKTLKVSLSRYHFYLAPQIDMIKDLDDVQKKWAADHFHLKDEVFESTLADVAEKIGYPFLLEMIEESRRKIFLQFLNQENGCYFNNKKYGIYNLRPFGRTEDECELPELIIEMFTTDYFTHRVMKDVCKKIANSGDTFFQHINFTHLGLNRIFYTSLGVNLLLLESASNEKRQVLLTARSTNASETYQEEKFSLSMIEGVSASDYDAYHNNVNINFAVMRGLKEELDVEQHMLNLSTLHFYELFVNDSNQEMGISCSVELNSELTIRHDVLNRHGKDELLEIADKRIILLSNLWKFTSENRTRILPQAEYTIYSYLESVGVSCLNRYFSAVFPNETFLCSKMGRTEDCGDAIVSNDSFIAVIDGATPKGTRLWQGMTGDVYVAKILAEAIRSFKADIKAEDAIQSLNRRIQTAYTESGVTFESLAPEERLQATVAIYSVQKREIWNFGDCKIRINQKNYENRQKSEVILANLRALCIELERLNLNSTVRDLSEWGREQILPYLKKQILLCNIEGPFCYDALNGGPLILKHIQIYSVHKNDHVVIASDGYPTLFNTLEETEQYLTNALKQDPECISLICGTKGVSEGSSSFDDRSFISFTV